MRLGLLGLDRALHRARDADREGVACVAVGECLLWLVAVDDARAAEYGDARRYRRIRDADWNGHLLPGLRWARNSVAHELAGLGRLVPVFRLDVSRLDGESVLGDEPDRSHELFWPYLDSIPPLHPPANRGDRDVKRWKVGRASYVEHLEGQRVTPLIERAAYFLTEGPTDAG